ncbi:MAG TPA: TerB family tellurite resistance protein [Kofleriaceae bacterium]|nr:TerB family tellurite resistance protein [Kofleriaceae bacterium]
MAESQILSVIRMWAAVAWADGIMSETEADSLNRLIRTADLTEQERTAARGFVETKTGLPETYLTNLTPEARRGIYRAACRMAVVDHVFSVTERALLDRMRNLLGVPPEAAQEIEAEVPGIIGR